MAVRDPAKARANRAKYEESNRKDRSAAKQEWFQRQDPALTKKRNDQTALLKKQIPVVQIDGQGGKGHRIVPTFFSEMTPKEVAQCFTRDADGILNLRTVAEQLDVIRALKTAPSIKGKRTYSVIQNKVFFNRNVIMTADEIIMLSESLKKRLKAKT